MKYNETIAETYPMNDNIIKLNIIWFKNNFELMNKELAENENELQELNEKILYLNSNILNLEQIFKGKLNNNNQNSDNITLEQNNPIDAPTLNQIIGLGDKVEDYILHISGKEQIIWEDVSYWLNVILLGVLVVQFLRRFDIIELSLCFGVFGVLYDKIDLKYSYHILFAMIGNLILELIWILYYMSNWNVNILHEQTGGITLRKVVLIFAWVGFFASIMLIFAFWKYILERKIKETNTGDIDFMDLTEKIDSLSDLKEQLLEIENMITEIESAEQNERQIALNLSMPTADNQYSFLVNNSCNAVLELLYSERKKLRSSIISVIEKIQIRSTKNVRKTLPENTDRGVVYND